MKYRCLEFQWIEPNSGHEPSTEFNKFSKEHDGEFEILHIAVVSSRNTHKQVVETLYVMIEWL